MNPLMEEPLYRKNVSEHFDIILKVIDEFDPDLIEAELSQGALTIISRDRSKTILSQQPSVRQIWLAAAALGKAVHFSWDESSAKWLDDKGTGAELFSYLAKVLKETAGLELSFQK